MSRNIIALFLLVITINPSWSQLKDDRGFYLVEAETFTPPIKDMIASFEGMVAEGFLAPDIYGKEHYLYDYRGKPTILFFFNLEEEKGRTLLETLKGLPQDIASNINIIGMAKDSKDDLLKYMNGYTSKFPLIYNGEVFGEMAYGADLGTPRMFIIDETGIIKRVLPATCFDKSKMVSELIAECINNINE
ncbi:MAG: redoxin domain-containing protein [Saprospiraceae bacterium]|nr:redoxin domain-containing protein [Saprospiraceae bacterium]